VDNPEAATEEALLHRIQSEIVDEHHIDVVNPIERLELLAGDDEAIASFLDQIDDRPLRYPAKGPEPEVRDHRDLPHGRRVDRPPGSGGDRFHQLVGRQTAAG
jgi:hypothetical protein